MKKLIAIILLAVGAVAVIYFLNQSKTSENVFFPASEVKAGDVVVTINDSGFSPAELTIKKGQKVTWVNKSSNFSWPASDPHPTHTNNPTFDPDQPMKIDEAWSFTFKDTGRWNFHDHLRPSMRGLIVVE
jgi:plastocyanin